MSQSLLGLLGGEFEDLIEPVALAAQEPDWLARLLATMGINTSDVAASPLNAVLTAVVNAQQAVASLTANPNPTFDDMARTLSAASELFTAARSIESAGGLGQLFESIGADFVQILITGHLAGQHPLLYALLKLATVVQSGDEATPTTSVTSGSDLVRLPMAIDRIQPKQLIPLLRDPVGTLKAEYIPTLATVADANAAADTLFPRVAAVLQLLGVPCKYGVSASDSTMLGSAGPLMDHALTVFLAEQSSGAPADIGLNFAFSSADRGNLGLVITPFGGLSLSTGTGNWKVALSVTADVGAVAYGPEGLALVVGGSTTEVTATLDAKLAAPTSGPAFVMGAPTGSRLEVGGAEIKIATSLSQATQTLALSGDVSKSALVISGGDGDGFVSSVLPSGGLTANFDLGLAWSNTAGFSVRGSAGLDATLPIGLSVGGVTLASVHVALQVEDAELVIEISLAVGASLGPVQASIDRIGLLAGLAFPDTGGNLGVADLSFTFKPPSGVGLAIDSAGLVGGGFLDYDPAAAQYAGMLQLAYEQFQLQAFGLITTKLPTGPGYSLVAMIDANFPPIELVAGFTLDAVGGLLGVNRTISTDALQAALKAHTLSTFLFVKNPVANATQLLTDLQTFFPAASGAYVFGPLLQIGWGTPTVLTLNLALLLTLPDPVRLVLLGELDVLLPDPKAAVLEMHMDLLGTIDFTADEGSLDAVLHDSRLAHYPLTGAMAMRACWAGSSKEFLLAIGGFNPAFQPPASFPTLPRVAINMKSGSIAKLNLAGYVAVTSNTLQIGANIDLAVGVDGFGISGYLNFDTLIQFSPFHFEADISGGIELTAGGDDLMSLDLAASMSGPSPWHVAGKVHFSILGFGVSKSFSETFGDSSTQPALQSVDVGAALRAALGDPRNYSASLTTNQNGLVSVRTPTTTGVALGHPAASLNIDQRIVPLGLTIARFGAAPPQGDKLFTITATTVDGNTATTVPLNDEFAPAQFLDLSDDQELSSPSFESFDAGVSVAQGAWRVGEAMAGSAVIERAVAYETYLIDTTGGQARELTGVTPVQPTHMIPVLSGLLNSGTFRYAGPSRSMVLPPLGYVVATTDQIAVSGVGVTTGQTYAQARGALGAAVAQNPNQLGALQVVPLYEVPS